jgi:hypothetical protein
MVRLTFALLPSPLLGPKAWDHRRGAALGRLVGAGAAGRHGAARRAGLRAEAVPRGTADGPGPRAGASQQRRTLRSRTHPKRRVVGYVFVDAILPPDGGTVPVAPQHLVTRYLRSAISLPVNWNRYPGAYLAFGDTYAEDRATASAFGWPTATITGRHLHQLHQPDVVAERILALARQAGLESLSPSR